MQSIRKCPICEKEYTEYPAISRKDNKIEICSQCGTEEALLEFFEENENHIPKIN